MTKEEIQAEIDEFSALLNESSVPQDEKDFAKSEIIRLKGELAKIKEKPSKKNPVKSAPKKPTKKVSKARMEREFGKEFMASKDKGTLKEYQKKPPGWNDENPNEIAFKKMGLHRAFNPKVDYAKEWAAYENYNKVTKQAVDYEEYKNWDKMTKDFLSKKSSSKPNDPDCDDLLTQYNKRRAHQKKSAAKTANTPTVKKDEKAIKKVTKRIVKHYKDGELTVPAIKSLIKELTEKINELRQLLKSSGKAKKYAKGGGVNGQPNKLEAMTSVLQELIDDDIIDSEHPFYDQVMSALSMSSEIDEFWTVTRPTSDSTFLDIFFKSDIQKMRLQFLGGLTAEELVGIYSNKSEATTVAEKLLSENVDLFENYEDLPENVQAILNKYSSDDNTYDNLSAMSLELEPLGYAFEYGLDAVPYNLHKITVAPHSQKDLESRINRGKSEIIADIRKGVVPDTIKSFSDLHDYVDANEYCGFTEDGYVMNPDDNFENQVQNSLSLWIQSGQMNKDLKSKKFKSGGPISKLPQQKGDIVQISNPMADEDPNMYYVVVQESLEEFSDSDQIDVQALGTGLSFPPISRIQKHDLKVVVPASKVKDAHAWFAKTHGAPKLAKGGRTGKDRIAMDYDYWRDKKILGHYEVKNKDIDTVIEVVGFEDQDGKTQALYQPTDSPEFKKIGSIMVPNHKMGAIQKGQWMSFETSTGLKVKARRIAGRYNYDDGRPYSAPKRTKGGSVSEPGWKHKRKK